jgi:hypothetical protein
VPKTQSDYIRRVKNFAVFLGRTPDHARDYQDASYASYDTLAERHRELVAKIEAGNANPEDRLEELVTRAELETAQYLAGWQHVNGAALRLRQQKVEAIVWALNTLLRPTEGLPKGKASKPMKEHHQEAVRACGVERTQNLKTVTGLEPLLDICSFRN